MDKTDLFKFREYHWNYFSMHADQRLKTFNFYIVVISVFIGSFLNIINKDSKIIAACILPYALTFISFIFWKLDMRTKGMIKIAENAIKLIDDQLIINDNNNIPNELNIFRYDDYMSSINKYKKNIIKNEFSYSKCFNSIFLIIGILGLFGGTFYLFDCLIYK